MTATGGQDRAARLAEGASAFGRWLSYERAVRGVERSEVVRLGNLPASAVDALETGDPRRLPPAGYAVGYLRAYAQVIGLDADDVVLRYQEEVVGPEDGEGRRPRRRAFPVRSFLALAAAVAVAVLAAVSVFGAGRQRAPLKLDRPRAVERAPYTSNFIR